MIEDFIDSALIIDDKENEIAGLKVFLESMDIWTKFYTPEQLRNLHSPLKNRKIIFLDLYIDDNVTEAIGQISIIRKIFEKVIGLTYGTYGIVLWSAHSDEIYELKKRIINDIEKYNLPLFIIGLDKNKYLRNGFENIYKDLNNELRKNVASSFFIDWNKLVNEGKDKAINNIYSLIKDYEVQDENLRFILFQLARNLTGVNIKHVENYPLYLDAFAAFNDMMTYEITKESKIDCNVFKEPTKIHFIEPTGTLRKYRYTVNNQYFFEESSVSEKDDIHKTNIEKLKSEIGLIYAQINSKILFDESNLDTRNVVPGNIYEILEENNMFKIDDVPQGSIPIVIELTPKCDFSNENNIYYRLLGGIMLDFDENKLNSRKKEYSYRQIYPISFSNKTKPQMIFFDFRYFSAIDKRELLDSNKYKLILRAKDKMFAEILQKLSSHTARLGLSIIHGNV